MKLLRLIFVKRRQIGRMTALTGGCGLLAACVGAPFSDTKIDPTSPVAADVAKLARTDRDYPSFCEIPPIPRDVRAPRLYGQAAREAKMARAQLETATAPGTWTLQSAQATEEFAERARRAAPDTPPSARAADPEAFARELRERATPPPPR